MDNAGLQQRLAPVQHELRRLFEQGREIRWYRISGMSAELLAKWEALWTFVRVAGVEPTNNSAKRALRPAVLWRKGCFGAQSAEGNQFVERMLTVIATCRQQDRHLLTFLNRRYQRPLGRSTCSRPRKIHLNGYTQNHLFTYC